MTDYFSLSMQPQELLEVSNLGLAHMGDAVYDLMVRAWAIRRGGARAGDLHRRTVRHVSAPSQAASARLLLPELTEEERSVFRRARNSHVHGIPHGSTAEEYHLATALEALFGWLYLRGERERLNQLFAIISGGWDDAL